jgi:hypothetical protein
MAAFCACSSGQPGDETVRVTGQFRCGLVAEDDLLVRDEQHQQHGWVAGQRQARPLAGRVDDDIPRRRSARWAPCGACAPANPSKPSASMAMADAAQQKQYLSKAPSTG